MKAHRFKIISIAALVASLTSCGGEERGAPDGSAMTISPEKTAMTVTEQPAPCSIFFNDTPVTITVRNASGMAMAGVDLTLAIDFPGVVEVYDGHINTLNATPLALPTRLKTGDDGTTKITVAQYYGCSLEYLARLNVYSGTAYAVASFSVALKKATP